LRGVAAEPDSEAARVCPKLAPALLGAAAARPLAAALDGVAGAVPGCGVAPLCAAGLAAAPGRASRC
jgi:hypothetical protein